MNANEAHDLLDALKAWINAGKRAEKKRTDEAYANEEKWFTELEETYTDLGFDNLADATDALRAAGYTLPF